MRYRKVRGLLGSPLACFILYIAVIMAFAGVYCILPNQFYHTNIMREREFNDLENVVREQFRQTLLRNLQKEEHRNYIPIDEDNKFLLKADSITVDRFTCEDNSFDITVHVFDSDSYQYKNDLAFMEFTISYNIRLIGTRILLEDNSILQTAKVEQTNRVYDAIRSVETDTLIDISRCFRGENWNFVAKVTNELEQNLDRITQAHNGYASYVQNNFFRMFYLSVVTITTLGYGDIVPITDTARILIGIEAFLGVMIAGLFVNALFQRSVLENKET